MPDEKKTRKLWSGPGGALLCNEEIPDVTQTLDDETARYYLGRYFVGETIINSAAKKIAELLGGAYREKP